MPRYEIDKEIDDQMKIAGWVNFNYIFDYIGFLKMHKDELKLKFLPFDRAYQVYKKRRKIVIREIIIDAIQITNIVNYVSYGDGFATTQYFTVEDNIFSTKEAAFEYAEQLKRRSEIIFIPR